MERFYVEMSNLLHFPVDGHPETRELAERMHLELLVMVLHEHQLHLLWCPALVQQIHRECLAACTDIEILLLKKQQHACTRHASTTVSPAGNVVYIQWMLPTLKVGSSLANLSALCAKKKAVSNASGLVRQMYTGLEKATSPSIRTFPASSDSPEIAATVSADTFHIILCPCIFGETVPRPVIGISGCLKLWWIFPEERRKGCQTCAHELQCVLPVRGL